MKSLFENKSNRSKQELILILLSACASIGLIPFIVLRLLLAEWAIATFNISLFITFVMTGLYVYKSRKTGAVRSFFAIVVVVALLIGFHLKGAQEIPWAYPGLVLIYFAVRPIYANTLSSFTIVWLSVLLYPQIEIFELTVFLITLSFTCLSVYIFANLTRQQRVALTKLSRNDPLTNLLNRRAFEQKLDSLIGGNRKGQKYCLIIFDIDHFKLINDSHGHSVGDQVLIAISQLIAPRLRKFDRFYRIGGEEFAIVLSCSGADSGLKVAKEIKVLVEKNQWINDCRVTVSLGIAESLQNESRDHWFKRCDDALYEAKNSGRNTYRLAKPSVYE